MRLPGTLCGIIFILAVGLGEQAAPASELPSPPVAERRSVATQHHGIRLTDDYAWLRTADLEEVVEDPAALEAHIRAHLDAESSYARAVLAPNRALERQLVAEMRARLSRRDQSVPEPWGAWEYFTRYPVGAQRTVHCRRPRGGGPEQVLLDENVLAKGRTAFSVSGVVVSPDHNLLAYSVDEDGSERDVVKVRDLATGRDLPDTIAEIRGDVVWSLDSQWLFYVGRDPAKWGQKVYRHKLGTPTDQDKLVYEEDEEGFSVGLRVTLSDRFLVIESSDFSTSDIRVLNLANPEGFPHPVVERKKGNKYWVTNVGERLIVWTNADGAFDWKIGEKLWTSPANAPLREIVPHRAGHVIQDMIAYNDHLVWLERDRERGSQRILVRRWSDGVEHVIDFGETPGIAEIVAGLEPRGRRLRYTFQSMSQPKQVFEYDLESRERELLKVDDVPSGHEPFHYITRRVFAPADDGAQIPVTLLYRRDTKLEGSAPVWLYGYGAYGDTENPEFGTERLSLVDRGFIYAIAHVRGGGEKGEAWHEAGRLGNKTTTFTDFIAVAEHLVRLGATRPGRIAASGQSAGGLLVGAAVNMRPDLFGAIYVEVPFVDVLNTLLDRSLPLTEASFSEFGNPGASRGDFQNIRSYSPYNNVRAQAYPPMLIVPSLNDARVPYWEAAKWVARLRHLKTDNNPIILYVKRQGGHNGGSGRYDNLQEFARAYAFALQALGAAAAHRASSGSTEASREP